MLDKLKYRKPNFNREWLEANRYPEFQDIGKSGWLELATNGSVVRYSNIKDVLGNVNLDFDSLEKDKKQRFIEDYKTGVIEVPIAVKFNDFEYDLLGGNTRLAGLVRIGHDPKIWVVQAPGWDYNDSEESLGEEISIEEDCWKGYKQVGGKMKNGKMVPNCVKESKEEYCDSCDRVKSKCVCDETKKVEATEATGAASAGQYTTTAAWAKSTDKKHWRGKSKTQIPGGKFVTIKKKCKTFPYCNQGDINALKIYENEVVKKVITKISKEHNISENVIKTIIQYEIENYKHKPSI